jgi:nucleotide-binding universal stress UspA family protein
MATRSAPGPSEPVVVVGFDGSTAAGRAVDAAVDEAGRRATGLVVLVVAGPARLWSDSVEELYGDAEQALGRATVTAAEGVRRAVQLRPDLLVDAVVCPDVESPAVTELARRAQLLVLGGRGLRGQHCLSVGATSAQLALAFACPLLVSSTAGPQGPMSGAVVVAGVDGRESSAAVLQAAATECRLRQRDLVAVHAYGRASAPPQHLSEICWRLFDQARPTLRAASGRADRLVFTRGAPVDVLTARAGAGDLLVLGTHSRGRLRASDADDVIRQVLDQAACDVLVVPSALP